MPRKPWTEEQKQAARERLAAAREAKKNKQTEAAQVTAQPQVTNVDGASTEELLKRALEAIAVLSELTTRNQTTGGSEGASIQNGAITGTVEKFATSKDRYADPTARLMEEPALRRFGFKENYELKYEYRVTRPYRTIDNLLMVEPEFQVDLIRVIFDEDTGEKTDGRYIEYRIVMHEDPSTALHVARENGINVDDYDEIAFLNEMRYLQIRDWLIGCFVRPKNTKSTNRREMAIGGKIVEYYEISSENSSSIPFANLGDSKL